MIYLPKLYFGPNIFYGLCMEPEKFHAELRKMKIKGTHEFNRVGIHGAVTHVLDGSKGELVCIVCVHPSKDTKHEFATTAPMLAHEATHVWQHMMENIGEKQASPELEAYGIQFITFHLLLAYEKLDAKLSKKKRKRKAEKKDIASPPAELQE